MYYKGKCKHLAIVKKMIFHINKKKSSISTAGTMGCSCLWFFKKSTIQTVSEDKDCKVLRGAREHGFLNTSRLIHMYREGVELLAYLTTK